MLIVLVSDLVELHLCPFDPEEGCLLVKIAELVMEIVDQGGHEA